MGVIHRNGISYGGSASINAHNNELLVGDGSDWAKKNIANTYITKRTDANSGTVAAIYSTEDNVELKSLDGSNNETNALKLFNGSKVKAYGGADIEIGDKDADYSQSGRTFWNNNLEAPNIKIGGTTFIELLGGDLESQVDDDTPTISMRGRTLVDMRGSRTLNNNNKKYNRKYSQYLDGVISGSGYVNPFNTNENLEDATVAFPYLHMHDTSSIIMDGGPVIKMEGNALSNIAGDVFIGIHGENDISSDPSSPRGTGGVVVDMRPGAIVQIGAGNSSTAASPKSSVLKLTEKHIFMMGSKDMKTDLTNCSNTFNYMADTQLFSSSPNTIWHAWEATEYAKVHDNTGVFVFNNNMIQPYSNDLAGTIGQACANWPYNGPLVCIHDKSSINIGDDGTVGIQIGGDSNSVTNISLCPKNYSAFEARLGSDREAADIINITNGTRSMTKFVHNAHTGATTLYEFLPHGDTYFRFAPMNKFFMNGSPNTTEILWQWQTGYVFLQGDNNFFLLDGAQTHIENVGNVFIMRDDTTTEVFNSSILTEDWSQPVQTNSSGSAKPIFQLYNRANLMMRADTIHKIASNEYTQRPIIPTYTYTFTATETYDLTDVNAAIRQFIAGTDYAAFTASIASGYELWRITNFENVSGSQYTITYTRKETGYTEFLTSPQAQEPILEMVGGSELRMYLGAYITAKTEYGETTITFGSRNSNEAPVSFTLAELTALKSLLAQPRLAQMTEQEYQQLDPPDPNTVYVLNSGGN